MFRLLEVGFFYTAQVLVGDGGQGCPSMVGLVVSVEAKSHEEVIPRPTWYSVASVASVFYNNDSPFTQETRKGGKQPT